MSARAYLIIALLLIALGLGGYFGYQKYQAVHKPAPVTTACDPVPAPPAGSQLLDPCATVSGTVDRIVAEPNGNLEVQLRLDRQYAALINEFNVEGQGGTLPVHLTCSLAVPRPDAYAGCGQDQAVRIPAVSDHVTYTGGLLNDTQHGWNELALAYDLR